MCALFKAVLWESFKKCKHPVSCNIGKSAKNSTDIFGFFNAKDCLSFFIQQLVYNIQFVPTKFCNKTLRSFSSNEILG